jgi:hypothetical protein
MGAAVAAPMVRRHVVVTDDLMERWVERDLLPGCIGWGIADGGVVQSAQQSSGLTQHG